MASDLPQVTQVALQPLAAQVLRLVDALDYFGAPLPADRQALRAAADPAKGVATIQADLSQMNAPWSLGLNTNG